MSKTIWKEVKGFEGVYEVSNTAEVRRVKKSNGATVGTGCLLKTASLDKQSGYLKASGLWKNNVGRTALRTSDLWPLLL